MSVFYSLCNTFNLINRPLINKIICLLVIPFPTNIIIYIYEYEMQHNILVEQEIINFLYILHLLLSGISLMHFCFA